MHTLWLLDFVESKQVLISETKLGNQTSSRYSGSKEIKVSARIYTNHAAEITNTASEK